MNIVIIIIISYQEQPKVVLNKKNRKLTVLKIHRPSDGQTDGQTNVFDCSDSNAYEEFIKSCALNLVFREDGKLQNKQKQLIVVTCAASMSSNFELFATFFLKKYRKKIKLHFPVDLWPEGWTDNPTVVMVVHGNERLFNASISAVLSRTDSQITIG